MCRQIWSFGLFRCRWKPKPMGSTRLQSSVMAAKPTPVTLSKSGHRLLLVSVRGSKMRKIIKRFTNSPVDSRSRKVKRILKLTGPSLFKRCFWTRSVSLWISGHNSWKKSTNRANFSSCQEILGTNSTCLCVTLRVTWRILSTMALGQAYLTNLHFCFNDAIKN